MKRAIITLILASCAVAAQHVTDADERYRIKYGRYPQQVEQRERQLIEAWKNRSEQLFKQLDVNKDGRVTDREALVAHGRLLSTRKTASAWLARFHAADSDFDGVITREEWRTGREVEAGQ
jgi:hypothetical protein